MISYDSDLFLWFVAGFELLIWIWLGCDWNLDECHNHMKYEINQRLDMLHHVGFSSCWSTMKNPVSGCHGWRPTQQIPSKHVPWLEQQSLGSKNTSATSVYPWTSGGNLLEFCGIYWCILWVYGNLLSLVNSWILGLFRYFSFGFNEVCHDIMLTSHSWHFFLRVHTLDLISCAQWDTSYCSSWKRPKVAILLLGAQISWGLELHDLPQKNGVQHGLWLSLSTKHGPICVPQRSVSSTFSLRESPWWNFSSRTQQTTMWGWKPVAWCDIWAPRTRNRWIDANSRKETTSSFVCGMWTAPGTTSWQVPNPTPWRMILVWIYMSGRFRITPAGLSMTSMSHGEPMPEPNCRPQPMRNQIVRNGKGKWKQELVSRAELFKRRFLPPRVAIKHLQPRLVTCRFKAFDLRLSRCLAMSSYNVIISKSFVHYILFTSHHFKSIAARRTSLCLAVMIATAWRDTCQSCEPLWLLLRVELCGTLWNCV